MDKTRSTTTSRIYKEDKPKLLELSGSLKAIQKKQISEAEIFRRMLNIPNLKDVLVRDAELKKEDWRKMKPLNLGRGLLGQKRGLVAQIMIVLILFIVVILLMGGFWIASTIGPIIVGEGTAIATQVQQGLDTSQPNSSIANASAVATETTTNILGVFEIMLYLFFIGFFVGFIILCFYVRTYPFLAFFWVFMIIFLTFFAMLMSNAYGQARDTNPDIQAFYQSWGSNDFLMSHLPHVIAIFGTIGGIILFVLVSKDPESEVEQI